MSNRYYLFALSFCLLHLIMLIYDSAHPDIFFHADRALQRFEYFERLEQINDWKELSQFLAMSGNLGDYFPQWLLYHFLGKIGMLIIQIMLTLLSGHAVYRIAKTLGLGENKAILAGTLYLLLPHTLVFPHQLASEAIFIPLLLISIWLSVDSFPTDSLKTAGVSGIILGLANLVRPVAMLWPFGVAILLACFKRYRLASTYLLTALMPVIFWMSFIAVHTGQFSMGESNRDLGFNLYHRIIHISKTLPEPAIENIHEHYLTPDRKEKMSAIGYLNFAIHYPVAVIKYTATDLALFLSKSGIERITMDYFPLHPDNMSQIQDLNTGWRTKLNVEGVAATVMYLWEQQGLVLVTSILGALMMVTFSLLTIYGAKEILMDRTQLLTPTHKFIAAQLVALPIYIFILSTAVEALQSRHRAPAEAAMVILSIYGVCNFINRRKLSFSEKL